MPFWRCSPVPMGLWQSLPTVKRSQVWLETFLELPNGIPSHDTFGRVFGLLDPQELETSFLSWVSCITEKLALKLIHIDGKTTKGSYDRAGQLKALQSVSAWSSEHGLVLASAKSGEQIQ
ncbi:ISAs1 family transposase [Moorena bouillonii]|uniref:ISAs1 family transposase n=1 Tax=Moorena bouillonii TaxID=207920 RepID=UPI0022A94388|nr:ISAs1 family transposase [Moorena bouillonii]